MAFMCLRLVFLGGVATGGITALARAPAPDHARFAGDEENGGTGLIQMSADYSQKPSSGYLFKEYALMVSSKGMSSHVGAGVRQMVMMMDLKKCRIGVDTLTETSKEQADWTSPMAYKILEDSTNFHVLRDDGTRSGFTVDRTRRLMQRYSRIIFFGWAWELEITSIANVALQALQSDPSLHSKVTLVLDDNPSNRCYGTHNLSFCRERAPAMLSRWLNVSQNAVAISQEDATELNALKEQDGFPGPQFKVWPLNLQNLQYFFYRNYRRIDELGFNPARPYLTMVANDHAENRRFVSQLVVDGELQRLCNASRKWQRLLFVGKITYYMRVNFKQQLAELKDCVHLMHEVLDERLQDDILPKTTAIINPFLETVQSGISVKTFEAIALRIPIVTSLAGFRGLEKCGQRLDQARLLPPSNPRGYVDFIVDRLINKQQSIRFVKEQQAILQQCIAEQEPPQCS